MQFVFTVSFELYKVFSLNKKTLHSGQLKTQRKTYFYSDLFPSRSLDI